MPLNSPWAEISAVIHWFFFKLKCDSPYRKLSCNPILPYFSPVRGKMSTRFVGISQNLLRNFFGKKDFTNIFKKVLSSKICLFSKKFLKGPLRSHFHFLGTNTSGRSFLKYLTVSPHKIYACDHPVKGDPDVWQKILAEILQVRPPPFETSELPKYLSIKGSNFIGTFGTEKRPDLPIIRSLASNNFEDFKFENLSHYT